ncbi:MAG: putative C-S lyase [Anaerolineaceae bacterium]|nr:putative C-S lyase [Anaerolineaceae bacterium]MCB9099049.1 putative C-S lyase [Anaerolineales bacterium]
MHYNFDEIVDRSRSDSAKWTYYDKSPLPLWVADMDFRSPEPVIRALTERVTHGVFGYGMPPLVLAETICQRMQDLYQWEVTPGQIIYVPSIVSGFNIACRTVGEPGDEVLVQTPVYPPFLTAPKFQDRVLATADLTLVPNGKTIRYEIDYDRFEAAITPKTQIFLLCNPHNPIGRGFSREEQLCLADICLRHDITICSDEIHSDLLLGGTTHIPMATLSPEIADRCITLIAPSKTFNMPGLACGIAIIQNDKLRRAYEKTMRGLTGHINIMGYTAALAAYTEGGEWLTQLLAYLTANRDFVIHYINDNLPGVTTTFPESTYLAWLDCRQTGIEGNPFQFFLTEANVALNDGQAFGSAGQGFVRLNFGCPRSILVQALDQMRDALNRI